MHILLGEKHNRIIAMSSNCQEGEKLLKKGVAAVFFTPKTRFITKFYITNFRLIIKNQKQQYIKLSYEHIHEIYVENERYLCIRCNTPMRFFNGKEEYVRIFMHGLKRKEGGGLTLLDDSKWPKYWKKFINIQINQYQSEIARKKHQMQEEEEDLFLIEGVVRSKEGLDQFEIVKTRERLNLWFDDFYYENCMLYATNNRLIIKIKSGDFVIVPYSVIYTFQTDKDYKITINFSFPQVVEGFDNEISKMSIKRIPKDGEDYPAKIQERWIEEWNEFFKKVTSQFQEHKGAVSRDEMLEMLIEMKHSPTKYTLSTYAKQGWDRACGLALERFGYDSADLFIYMNFVLKEYEEMKTRSMAEPDPARQEAYRGSEMAYSSILAYINHHTKAR
ncbi:hypothetical protein DLD82_05775 [Methanospirillum stamsii]|uniref:Uncharacterized protein n=2 Tax=Methanospirillum stamsii TaxID=1277351 RepID=A0A2V2N998_9EURY|nr:hypothetical protein DLD82_05775 [Methanospirillum stamsii]